MIRIQAHPKDPGFLVLRIDQMHNGIIGSFQPARRQDDMGVGVYVMEAGHRNALQRWADLRDVHLLDEARTPGAPTRALECGNTVEVTIGRDTIAEHCAAPVRAGNIPAFCGACGQQSNPVKFDQDEPAIGTKCSSCSTVTLGGAAYCPRCATPLPERHLHAQRRLRVKGEPTRIGADVHRTVEALKGESLVGVVAEEVGTS